MKYSSTQVGKSLKLKAKLRSLAGESVCFHLSNRTKAEEEIADFLCR